MSGRRSSPMTITANTSLDEAQTVIKALYPIIRTTNDAKAVLQGKGWTVPNGEITLELLAKVLFATAINANKMDSASTNLILATGFLITEQIGSLTKANIVNGVTKHLLETLIPITTNFETKLKEHLQSVASSTKLHTDLNAKLQQTQEKLDAATEKVATNTKTHTDLSDKLRETQEKLDATSQKITTNAKTYSQAAATPPSFQPPTHGPNRASTTLAQMQMHNREEIKRRQVLIDFEKTDDLSLDILDERTLTRKATDTINTVWASTPEPKSPRPTLKSATLLHNGGLLLELDSPEAVDWLRKSETRERLLANIGSGACIKDRTYQIILQFVPVQFNPENDEHLRQYEEQNNIALKTVLKAEWIKPVKDRKKDQQVATLRTYHRDAGSANKILSSGAYIAGKRAIPKKPKREPIRCLFCQKFGHERRACRSEQLRCGRCAQPHETKTCTAQRQDLRCANCQGPHASFDRICQSFHEKCQQMDNRRPENNLAFYPTGEDWTWATIDQDIRTDPPAPSPQNGRPGAPTTRQTQSRLTGTNTTPIGPRTANVQQSHPGPSQ